MKLTDNLNTGQSLRLVSPVFGIRVLERVKCLLVYMSLGTRFHCSVTLMVNKFRLISSLVVGCPRVALAASPAIVNHSAGSTWSFPVRTLYTMAIQILTTGMGKCHEYWCWCVWPLCISKLKVYFFRLGRGSDGVGQSSTVQMLSKSPTKVPSCFLLLHFSLTLTAV